MLQLKASTPQHNLNIRLSNQNSQFSCNPITPSQLPNLTSDLVGVVVFHTARCHAAKHHITNEWWPLRPPHAWPQALARRVASKRASSRHFRRPRRKTFPKNVYSDLEPFSAGVNPSVDHSLWKLSIEITWLVVVCSSWRSSAVSRPLNRVQLVKCRCNTLFQLSSSVNKTQQQQKKQKKNQLIIRNKTPDSLTRHNCPGQMTSVNVGFRCRYWRHSYWSNWKFFRDSICFYLFVGFFFLFFQVLELLPGIPLQDSWQIPFILPQIICRRCGMICGFSPCNWLPSPEEFLAKFDNSVLPRIPTPPPGSEKRNIPPRFSPMPTDNSFCGFFGGSAEMANRWRGFPAWKMSAESQFTSKVVSLFT